MFDAPAFDRLAIEREPPAKNMLIRCDGDLDGARVQMSPFNCRRRLDEGLGRLSGKRIAQFDFDIWLVTFGLDAVDEIVGKGQIPAVHDRQTVRIASDHGIDQFRR